MVLMAVLDLIWTGISSAALLVFVAIMGFIAFKIGLISFKIAVDVMGATRGIENIEGVVKRPNYRVTEKEDEIEIIVSYINSFIERNYYAKYMYQRFEIEKILSRINSLRRTMESKNEKSLLKYAYIQLFKK
jgi:hypothetical protein